MKKYMYVGCRTSKRLYGTGKGLSVYESEDGGPWNLIQTLPTAQDPAYLTYDRTGRYIYCVHGDTEEASAFRIDPDTHTLAWLNTVSLGGKNPVYAIPDKTNQFILFACLDGEMLCAVQKESDGSLGQVIHTARLPGSEKGMPSCPHMIHYDIRERYLIVPAKGGRGLSCGASAGVHVYTFDPEEGFSPVFNLGGRNLDECRHAAFHPDGRRIYILNEKRNVIIAMNYDPDTGSMVPFQMVQTLPDSYVDLSPIVLAAGIVISEDGQYLYVVNRGADSIAAFRVDPDSGRLNAIGWTPSGGRIPWSVQLQDHDRTLYAANLITHQITAFRIRPDGIPEPFGEPISAASPSYMIFS